ncbi:hypothetical protein GN244_ATG08004 [Phytophthora infestans]|uniref:Uncharacterized protein n=1 Tax=Phytophthora infestans TaxID=4787 RepID=A0A833T9Z2_PHYIN|nr:hypothetical protein GN244_ATG08004 [Phytophthora infestans]
MAAARYVQTEGDNGSRTVGADGVVSSQADLRAGLSTEVAAKDGVSSADGGDDSVARVLITRRKARRAVKRQQVKRAVDRRRSRDEEAAEERLNKEQWLKVTKQ